MVVQDHTDSGIVAEDWQSPSPLWAAALDDPDAAVLIVDPQLRIAHQTRQVEHVLGLHDEVPSQFADLATFLSHTDLDSSSITSLEAAILRVRSTEAGEPMVLVSRDHSRKIHMRARGIGQLYTLTSFTDITDGGSASIPAHGFGSHDALTGLFTRSYFENKVSEALSGSTPDTIAVFLIDLDRFKAVNDTLGHAAGDAVLRLVAQRLRSVVRSGEIVARLGGDEFAVFMHIDASHAQPAKIAQRIVDLVGRTYLIEGQLVNIGASVGVALAPQDGTRCETLLRSADLALYQSKSSGRCGFHFFTPEMEARAQRRRANELDLRRAIALRQLELHYQPQIDIETAQLTGFEALVRWRHPQRGLIPPGDFLGLAEEIGIIVQIGEWVLRTACREAAKWPEHLSVAVNASPLQFESGRFANSVRHALEQTQLTGSRLEIEITEGILLRNEESVLSTLRELSSMGVRIAMDDFGTGYASLSQLARFPFDKIKLDRSLVASEGDSVKHRAIVRAITSLGASLGIPTLAEGIETADQLKRIQSDGCGSVQGYFFSKPVPSGDLEGLIERFAVLPTGFIEPGNK